MYLKTLGIHIYFASIKDSYCLDGKNLEANAKAIYALKSTLNDEYLSSVANFDSAFVVWNTLISLVNKSNTIRIVTRMMDVMLPTYTTWSMGITSLR